MKKKVNHYTDDFKLKVVQEYLNTDAGFYYYVKLCSLIVPFVK